MDNKYSDYMQRQPLDEDSNATWIPQQDERDLTPEELKKLRMSIFNMFGIKPGAEPSPSPSPSPMPLGPELSPEMKLKNATDNILKMLNPTPNINPARQLEGFKGFERDRFIPAFAAPDTTPTPNPERINRSPNAEAVQGPDGEIYFPFGMDIESMPKFDFLTPEQRKDLEEYLKTVPKQTPSFKKIKEKIK